MVEGELITNAEVFEEGYRPSNIVGRENTLRDIYREFPDHSLSTSPKAVIVHGWPHSGKTTVLDRFLSEFEILASEQDVALGIERVDCSQLESVRDLFVALLLNRGNETVADIPPEKQKYTTYTWLQYELRREIETSGAELFVFGLDDIDALDDPTEALQRLLFLDNECGSPRVGFVATTGPNGVPRKPGKLYGKYQPRTMSLSYLDRDDYEQVLEQRAFEAFKEGVVSEEAVEQLVEKLYEGVRIGVAIAVLHRAGVLATQNGATTVEPEHVDRALGDREIDLGVTWLLDMDIDIHNQALLLAMATGEAPNEFTRVKPLYDEYLSLLEDKDDTPLSYRRFRDRVTGDVLAPGLTTKKRNDGSRGGIYLEVKLDWEPETIFGALSHETYQSFSNHQSIQSTSAVFTPQYSHLHY